MHVLLTGDAGFIGHHVALRLIERGDRVTGVDLFGPADAAPTPHPARLRALAARGGDYAHQRLDIADAQAVQALFEKGGFERVIHLAARAGVRESALVPLDYARSNLTGFANLIEACRRHGTPHLTYASSSSVYGANTQLPYAESDDADHPLQFYAATKRANELMAHAYSHLHRLPTTGLRLFSVYGPWGRPDMIPWLFTERILAGEPIELYRGGDHGRDFTFVEDVADAIVRCSDQIAPGGGAPHGAPWRVFNVGRGETVGLMDFVRTLETVLERPARCVLRDARPGDALATLADTRALHAATGWSAGTPLPAGLARWAAWYRGYRAG